MSLHLARSACGSGPQQRETSHLIVQQSPNLRYIAKAIFSTSSLNALSASVCINPALRGCCGYSSATGCSRLSRVPLLPEEASWHGTSCAEGTQTTEGSSPQCGGRDLSTAWSGTGDTCAWHCPQPSQEPPETWRWHRGHPRLPFWCRNAAERQLRTGCWIYFIF